MNRPFLILFALVVLLTRSLPAQDLPPARIPFASQVLAIDGSVLGYFGEKRRADARSLGAVSRHVITCLLATEDRDFYNHDGVSLKGLGRALMETLKGSTQGGSTLTMQLARNLYLTRDRTLERKFNEIMIARELEKRYSKDQLLLMYLNTVYFGHGSWGIWAASQEYFRKTPDKLTLTESALLVGLLKAPSGYDPVKVPDKALARRNEVMHNLVETGHLSEEEFRRQKSKPLGLNLRPAIGRWFVEFVRREATDIARRLGRNLNTDEWRITTTLDPAVQEAAEKAIQQQYALASSSMKEVQFALVSVDCWNGMIRAMVGGSPSADPLGWNRAWQSRRQAGSSFKPFLYGQILEQGATLATPLQDAPLIVDEGTPSEWRPTNDDGTFTNGPVPLRSAITHSLNLAAAYAMVHLTSPDSVAAFAHRCGITSDLPPFPSLALGTGAVSPLDMASALCVFPSGGKRVRPFAILKIEDKNYNLIYSATVDTLRVLDSAVCYQLTTALQTVVDSGTASVIRKFTSQAAAGKTGTTQNYADAWFVGYTPALSTAIWAGFDQPSRKLTGVYKYGGTLCAPVWGRMAADLAKRRHWSVREEFPVPTSVILLPLCRDTGLRARPTCPHASPYPVDGLRLPPECGEH